LPSPAIHDDDFQNSQAEIIAHEINATPTLSRCEHDGMKFSTPLNSTTTISSRRSNSHSSKNRFPNDQHSDIERQLRGNAFSQLCSTRSIRDPSMLLVAAAGNDGH
jgi:hypothetical protein